MSNTSASLVAITVPGGNCIVSQNSTDKLQQLLKSNFSTKVFTYTKPFDKNGYLYYIATNKLTTPWENPATTGRINVTATSTYSHYTNPHVCVNHDGHGEFSTSSTVSQPGEHVLIDLADQRPICVNYYCMKGAGSIGHALINWNLEASNDKRNWDALSEHKNFTGWTSIEQRKQGLGFPVENCRARYRYFRIISTGMSDSTPYYFVRFGGFELYGTV